MNAAYDDLRARWKPSDAQIAAANAAFAEHPAAAYVLSGHFLAGKEFGIWDTDIELLYADGVEIAMTNDDYREAMMAAELPAAKLAGDRTGTVGYAVHYGHGGWAVFEDILSPEIIRGFATSE